MRSTVKVTTQLILGIGEKEQQENRIEVDDKVLKWTGPVWSLVMRFI
jgi:hypothetical protein